VRKTWVAAFAGTTIFLMLATTPAWADWVKIVRTDVAAHYIDPATVRKDGDLRRVWTMQDMVQTSPDGVMSIRALQEYDCAEQRMRYLSVTAHSGPMAGGRILATHVLHDEWSDRPPGTKASAIEKLVCGR
jgi:Surface-adhesin protein E